jgi:competence protein ComEC
VIDKDIKGIYQNTGIAHLLAVSGLHVSVIIYVIGFILKKIKLSQNIHFCILIALLGFYIYLCSFSISVIRASLMAIILNYSYIRGKPYDRLSVLSLLATIILLVNPLQLFNVSFVLSFLAVLSIILLIDPIKRLLSNIFYDKFANLLALVLAVQIGLSVVNVFYFNKFQPFSFIANLISVPLATFAFLILLASVCVVVVFPSFSFLCEFIGEIYKFIAQYNNYLIELFPAVILPQIPAIIIPCFLILLFLISDYCFVKKKLKLPTIVSFCLIMTMLIVF